MPYRALRAARRAGDGPLVTQLTERFLYQPHDLASELRPREFHGRFSRRGRSLSVLARRTRKLAVRRIAVVLAAMAVPAMAAPGAFGDGRDAAFAASASLPQTEVASDARSFTARADVRTQKAAQPASDSFIAPYQPMAPHAQLPLPTGLSIGPVARPLMAAGSSTDRYRASQCLALAAYYEAASEGDNGMRAVAQVVLNRVSHPAWPGSVCGVVFQGSERATGCQFSFTCDGSMQRKPSAAGMMRARRVADAALGGYVFAPVGLATHYHTLAVHPYWASSLEQLTDIGFHRFYRWKGPAGTRAAFASLYRGGEPAAAPAARVPADYRENAVQLAAPVAGSPEPAGAASAIQLHSEPVPAQSIQPQAQPLQSGSVRPEYANSGQWLKRP